MLFLLYCLSVQRQRNPKMSIVYCSAPNINDNKCDTVPIDKLKYYSANEPAMTYMTWGLIWDLKTETEEIPKIFQITKIGKKESQSLL